MKRNNHHGILGGAILAIAICGLLPAAAQVKDYRNIDFPELPAFEVPSPEVFQLDNGMTVFLMEDHELPLISVTARIRTGANHMPADKEGMGSVFGQVQREGGTTSMSGDEMDDFLEARAASVETSMGGDVATASMSCLVEDFDDVFEVFIDVLRNPAFSEDKIELAKVQLNTSIARRNDNVGSIVGREFRRLIYGLDSPLARLTEYATVANVTRDDLAAWHKKYYHPNNLYLGFSGDFDSAVMRKKIEAALAGWPAGPASDPGRVPHNQAVEPGVYFIEKDDVTQANIRAGHLGIRRDNPDYFAVTVMNQVLGGGFSGRLMQNIRSEKGLAYSVFGGVGSSFMRPGIFQVGMSTKSSTMAESARALRDEVANMIASPATAEELRQAKEGILNSFVFNYTSRAQILGQQMTFAYYGLPSDYLEQYRANIEKVTVEDVARVAKKYMHPDKMVLLVVGPTEDYDEPPSALGSAKEIDIAIPPPPDTRPEVEKSASTLEAGKALLARVAGVLDPGSRPIRSGTASMKMELSMGGQAMTLGQELSFVLPDKLRQTLKTPMGDQVLVFNGSGGAMIAAGQSRPLPGEAVAEQLESLNRNLLVLASHGTDPELEAVAAGSDEVDGIACELVSVTFRGSESRLCVDGAGKVLAQSYRGKHPMQQTPGLMTVHYSGYAEVDGYLVPHRHVMSFEGEELATVTVDSIELNPEVDESLFELPTGG